jgi:hypothetical protein
VTDVGAWPAHGRTRGTLPRSAARWFGALVLLALFSIAGATTVLADCGNVGAATLSGDWQLKETVASYSAGPVSSFRKPVGFQNIDNVTIVSACSAAATCTATIPGSSGGPSQFDSQSPIGFVGPGTDQPVVQTGANVGGTYATAGGIGGPGLPPCSPPKGFLNATLTLHVVSAARDPQGNWRATLMTGTYSETAGTWTCSGGVGVEAAIEHVTLEAVPAGSTFPAHISATCAAAVTTPKASPGNPSESSISSALSTPSDAFSSLGNSLVNAAITLGIILFITFPSQLFNHTFEENYDEIRAIASRRLRWLQRLRREASASSTTMRSALIFSVVVLVGAVLGGLNDPKFGFNGRSAATYLAVILAILIGVTVSALVNYAYRRARGRDVHWQFHALPAGLAVAATCVLISRLSAFQPGYLYGIIAGIAFGGALAKNEAGHSVALGSIASLLIAILAWFAWVPVHGAASSPSAGFFTVVASDVLASLFIGGLVGSVIGLLPLRFLPGGTLLSWSRAAWAVMFGIAVFGLLEVELRPQSTAAHPGKAPIVTAIILFVLFGGLSVGMRVYFNARRRRLADTPATS